MSDEVERRYFENEGLPLGLFRHCVIYIDYPPQRSKGSNRIGGRRIREGGNAEISENGEKEIRENGEDEIRDNEVEEIRNEESGEGTEDEESEEVIDELWALHEGCRDK